MATRDLVVVGGSAGGVQAVSALLSELPAHPPAAIVIVLHTPATGPGAIARVLGRVSRPAVVQVTHGEQLRPGRVYVPPPDRHVVVHGGRLLLARSAKVNRVRPAADVLFRSAARWYGPRAVGVVVSGALDDGAVGLAAIALHGGLALVQDPGEALFAGMPHAAQVAVPGATVLRAAALAATLEDVLGRPVADPTSEPEADLVAQTDLAERDEASISELA